MLLLCAYGLLNAASSLQAQNLVLPMNEISQMRIERSGVQLQPGVHMGARPVFVLHTDLSKVDGFARDTTKYYYSFTSKIFSEDLIQLDKPGLQLAANFIFNFGYGDEWRDELNPEREISNTFENTRGFAIAGKVGNSVYFFTDFRENQSRFASYLDRFVDSLGVVPGNGRVKPFGEDAYDYNMASGFLGFNATDWLSVQAGHYKQFVGHGHRSLLLSDNAFNFPFVRCQFRFWEGRVQYDWNIGLMQSLDRLPQGSTPEALFQRKYSTWNYISFKPIPSIEIGFFEAVMWKIFDSETGTLPFNYASLNPLPFVNTLYLGLNDPDNNALIGYNVAWQPLRWWRIYGQYMRDGRNANGVQLGMKAYELFGRIDVQAEYNTTAAGSYAATNPLQSFTHTNQPLAHPMGSGFGELYTNLVYYHNRWYLKYEYIWAQFFSDFERDPTRPLSQEPKFGRATDLKFNNVMAAYIFNPRTNMQIYAGATFRNENIFFDWKQNNFWYIGIRTYLQNSYRDF